MRTLYVQSPLKTMRRGPMEMTLTVLEICHLNFYKENKKHTSPES